VRLVVEQLVHHGARHEDAEAAGAQAHLLAHAGALDHLLGGVAHRGVRQVQVALSGFWPDPDLNAADVIQTEDPGSVLSELAEIEGTNADATLWNPSCQPNDAELPCRRVQAQDGIATLKTRGTLTSLTLRLSRDGDDWTAPPIAIDDVASQIRNGILSLPDAPAPAAAAACASEGPWLKQRLQQFKGWKSSRLLNITAVVSASGVDFGRNAALDADEKTALASFVRPPPSAKPGCRATPVTANGLHARVQ